jgi:lipoate-protein ligase A
MLFQHAIWRLIITKPSIGAWNMAVDEAILESVSQGLSPATLRLYSWDPPCLSLGYAQSYNDVDRQRVAELGWHVVRRPTGGRAILHTDELTYAVIGPLSQPRLSGSLLESYQRISAALLEALRDMKLPVQAEEHVKNLPGGEKTDPICFEVPSHYEITYDGKKIIGSAQARKKGVVLQHGSFPLEGDLSRITEVLRFSNHKERVAAAERLNIRAVTAEQILGQPLSWQTASQAFVSAFERSLNISLIPGDLSADESQRAEVLVGEKFANQEWTARL